MICVDASVAAKWVLAEDDSDTALALYRGQAAGEVIAAPFLPVEVTNAIWRRVARGSLTRSEADEALADFLEFDLELATPSGIYRAAIGLADRFARPAVYDMLHVALAQIAGCELWTADLHLLNALGGQLRFVKPLAMFSPR